MKKNMLYHSISAMMAVSLCSLAQAAAPNFVAGTYTASYAGQVGNVPVTVTLSKTKILSITVGPNKETIGIGSLAIEKLPTAIINQQSVSIDGLSGASKTSAAILNGVADCIRQAGGDPSIMAPAHTKKAGKSKTLKTDFVIIGGGGAGMVAAVNSADKGAKVVVLEKMAFTGGAAALCGGQYGIQGTQLQKSMGVPYYPPQSLVYDLIGNGHLHNDLTTLKMFAEQSPKAADWAIDRFQLKFKNQPLQYRAEFKFDRSHYLDGGCPRLAQLLREEVKNAGVEVFTGTKAQELILEKGKVVGVKATQDDGTQLTVRSKAVLLSTGGYGANKDMLVEPLKSALYYGPVSSTGDGHRMAQKLGAQLQLMEFGKRYPNGVEASPGVAKSIIQGNYRAWNESGFLVNKEGKRVINEKASNNDIMQVLEKQTGGMLYLVMDQKTFDVFREGIKPQGVTDAEVEQWLASNGKAAPLFAHGKTMEEVAANAGVDAANLKASVARYNEIVAKGKDEDFGRPAAFLKKPVGVGPYYIVEQKPRFATTMGSVVVNNRLQVLDAKQTPIKGLYAAGEITNAVHGDDSAPGMNIAWFITSGKLASESMLENLK